MSETVKVELNMSNLNMLSAFSPTEELKARMKKNYDMLKEKAKENWCVDVNSAEYKEMIKMRTWVSSDPAMADKIYQTNQITSQVINMKVVEELTKEEIESIIKRIDGAYYPNNELIIMNEALKIFGEVR